MVSEDREIIYLKKYIYIISTVSTWVDAALIMSCVISKEDLSVAAE